MSTYYKILRPVTAKDLGTHPKFADVLTLIPSDGYVTSETFRHLEKRHVTNSITCACSIGVLVGVSLTKRLMELDSIRFWITQFNDTGHKNTKSTSGTKPSYLNAISKFNKWLENRSVQIYDSKSHDETDNSTGDDSKSFANIEDLMEWCRNHDFNANTLIRIVRKFLTDPQTTSLSASTNSITRSAIKSYFGVHNIVLNLSKTRNKRSENISNDSSMTPGAFYRMLQNSNSGIMLRTVILIKFQSVMDSATLADRFNYDGYRQIVEYFGTENHSLWNLDLCPIPINLIRVKTNVRHITFLDRDAIAQLQEYLAWKKDKYGKQDITKPLFVTKRHLPINRLWISRGFSTMATHVGIQKKVSRNVFKMRAHKVRHLLKSTLLACGCKQYVVDHILGLAPNDTYERQIALYPEKLRTEYSKASRIINIITRVENSLNSLDNGADLNTATQKEKAEIVALKQSATENKFVQDMCKNATLKMHNEIKHLVKLSDTLSDNENIKAVDGPDGLNILINACEHDSDYAVLYDYMDTDHLLCRSCWNMEEHVRIDADTIKIFKPRQLRATLVWCIHCRMTVNPKESDHKCYDNYVPS